MRVVAFIALVLLAHSLEAQQLFRPRLEHYETAAEMLRMERAQREILELERAMAAVQAASQDAQRQARDRNARRTRLLDRWSQMVQRANGMTPRSTLPGRGWHIVHKP